MGTFISHTMQNAQGTKDQHVLSCDAAQVGLIRIRNTCGQLSPLTIKFLCILCTQKHDCNYSACTLLDAYVGIQNRVAGVNLLLHWNFKTQQTNRFTHMHMVLIKNLQVPNMYFVTLSETVANNCAKRVTTLSWVVPCFGLKWTEVSLAELIRSLDCHSYTVDTVAL